MQITNKKNKEKQNIISYGTHTGTSKNVNHLQFYHTCTQFFISFFTVKKIGNLNTWWKEHAPVENVQPRHWEETILQYQYCINIELTHKNTPTKTSQFNKMIACYRQRQGEPAKTKKDTQREKKQTEGALRGVYLRRNRWMCSFSGSLPVSVVSLSVREQHMLTVCENMPLPCAWEQEWILRAVLSVDYLQSTEFCSLAA